MDFHFPRDILEEYGDVWKLQLLPVDVVYKNLEGDLIVLFGLGSKWIMP